MRVLLTGGGTAGHINPALAIAESIRQSDPDAKIEFVGIRGGKEEDLVPRQGYKLHYVHAMGIRRSLSPANVKALWLAFHEPRAKETLRILDEFRPDIVIGTGGYASWPIMKAAARRKIPTAIHESNALPGLTVRQLQGCVDRIWTNFEVTANRLRKKEKILRVGNPLRTDFGMVSKETARQRLGIKQDQFFILSFGGSLGAEEVNRAVVKLMRELSSKAPKLVHLHASGKRDYQATKNAFAQAGLQNAANCTVTDYIYDMPLQMAAADLVICRAGAMTVSELSLMGKAAILIPSPHVADDHQYLNAKALADVDAAELIREERLAAGELTSAVSELLHDPKKRVTLEKNIQGFANRTANESILKDIQNLISKRKG